MRADQLEMMITNYKHMILITITLLAVGFVAKRFWRRNGLRALTFRRNPNRKDAAFCAVCLEGIAEGEKFRRLPECKHCFHVECIDAWFQSRSTCPLCRNDVAFAHEQKGEGGGGHLLLCYLVWCLKIIARMIDNLPVNFFENSFLSYGQSSTYIF
ncbi:hypothetical protein ACOSQ2_003913 [Xanthoceras sorbifolium]|uniref:RING-type E3 ubiquitin transferase n=1 Tax=Xanthoceras sorbifolium TaxID=99658 RepID=A0ABQ8IHE5_9ROSI|nr:hypothetical protein JRO89_XS01G0002700 [Xanthoceras sorbifolium]